MLNRKAVVLIIVAIGWGCGEGQQKDEGTDSKKDAVLCASHADCPGKACDEGVCRTACGSNYPGVACVAGETCDGWICRQSCDLGQACPAGTACDPTALVCRSGGTQHQTDAGTQAETDAGTQVKTDAGTQIPECISHSTCPGKLCDVGTCGTACGSNYPGVVCAAGETCDGWKCRQTCGAGELCPTGTTCDADAVCRPTACGQNSPCPARWGCADGTCVPVGNPCENSYSCAHQGLACDQGFCVLVCSDNAPKNICPLGQQCQNQLYCG